jgi:transcription antitermination factor NusG
MEGTPAKPESIKQELPWYAVRVRSNFERAVCGSLRGKGYESCVPVYCKRSYRSDRIKDVDLPLFRGYVFSRIDVDHRLSVLLTPGVVNVVGFGNVFIPIPEREIAAVQAVVRSGLPSLPWPFLREGQRVRIEHGSLSGIEGLLVQIRNEFRVVVSIALLQRSVSVEIDRSWIRPIGPARRRPVAESRESAINAACMPMWEPFRPGIEHSAVLHGGL